VNKAVHSLHIKTANIRKNVILLSSTLELGDVVLRNYLLFILANLDLEPRLGMPRWQLNDEGK